MSGGTCTLGMVCSAEPGPFAPRCTKQQFRVFNPFAKSLQFIPFGNQVDNLVRMSRKALLIGDH
jgi:hypothetical protein